MGLATLHLEWMTLVIEYESRMILGHVTPDWDDNDRAYLGRILYIFNMAAPMVWHESCSPSHWKDWVLFSFDHNFCVSVNETFIIMITVKEFIKSSRLLRMHRRYLCSSSGSKNRKSKKYADTLNLPRTQFQLSMKDVSTREKEVQSVSFFFF